MSSVSSNSSKAPNTKHTVIDKAYVSGVIERIVREETVRRNLPPKGRLHIDRPLPFLLFYRQPEGLYDVGTDELVTTEASYAISRNSIDNIKEEKVLLKAIGSTLKEMFGGFLFVEIWSAKKPEEKTPDFNPTLKFRLLRVSEGIRFTLETLEAELSKISSQNRLAEVEIEEWNAKKNYPLLFSKKETDQLGWTSLGIEIAPTYLNRQKQVTFPLILKKIRRGMSKALRKSMYEFTKRNTSLKPTHYQSLGRRSMVKSVWRVDQMLADISDQFAFLLLLSPTNPQTAWLEFQKSKYQKIPEFLYRRIPVDPPLLKRQLFKIPIEKIEDPTLARLFRDQQINLDRMLTMLEDRNHRRFLYSSLQMFGTADEKLLRMSRNILTKISPTHSNRSSNRVNAKKLAEAAREEVENYRKEFPNFETKVSVQDDISGLIVSSGNLFIGSDTEVGKKRVKALLHHEIGTHAVTYFNGRSQPFRQLYIGLPGYDELQEALAVLSEYLVGGLTRFRLRLLAARVLAVDAVVHGANLIEIFQMLHFDYSFRASTAFEIALRVCRSGGLTKDVVYLRGVISLLDYLRKGGEIEQFYVGKFGFEHAGMIRELTWRKILTAPPIKPRFFSDAKAIKRLQKLKDGISPTEFWNT